MGSAINQSTVPGVSDVFATRTKSIAVVAAAIAVAIGAYAIVSSSSSIKISWPHHVFVSKNFKVTGAIG